MSAQEVAQLLDKWNQIVAFVMLYEALGQSSKVCVCACVRTAGRVGGREHRHERNKA